MNGADREAAQEAPSCRGLPSIVVADITGRDADGELIAVPAEWDERAQGEAAENPASTPRRGRPSDVPGVGDRALVRTPSQRKIRRRRRSLYRGRPIKVIDRARHRVLGVFRSLGGRGPAGAGRQKNLGRELAIPQGATLRG